MRITTGMIQRNVLSDLNDLSSRLSKTQQRAASGKQITRPSDDPYNTARAMGLRGSLSANAAYKSNIEDAEDWQNTTESAMDSLTQFVHRASDLVVQGGSDSVDQGSRDALAAEIDQIIQGVKDTANTTYGDKYVFSGTATATPPYAQGADDTYKGNQGGLDPATPGVLREIGPGVSISINSVGQELLGDGQAAGDGKLLDTLRTVAQDLRSGNGAGLRGADLTNLTTNLNQILAVRARNGATTNRLQAADSRLDDISLSVTQQLSDTEDADMAQTLIDFNSQNAAYQSALRAGASIVQTSLMDFLK